MTFDPNQPRDDDGRWTHLAGRMKTHGGFTSLASGHEATKGFAVGIKTKTGADWRTLPHGSTTAEDVRKFAEEHAAELAKPNRGIGGWSNNNPDWGDVRDALDIVEVHEILDDAMHAARAAGQDAIYDLGKGQEIPVKKTLGPTAAEKIRNAEIMFGTGSAQHRKAIKMFTKDLSIYTPTFAGAYDLSVRDGKLAYWKQILPKRQIHYTDKEGHRRLLNFDEKYLHDLATNMAVDKVGFLLADKDNAHTMDPERWRGNVEQFEVRDDGLYGKIVFPSREAAKAVLDNPDLGVSARIREGIQKSDGSTVARGIVHVLGTLDPQVGGMSGWQQADLSNEGDDLLDLTDQTYEDGTMTKKQTKSVTEYTDEEIDAMTEEELDAFLAAAAEEFDGILDEEPAPEPEPEKEAEMALSTEIKNEIDLARSDARAARVELAQARWDKTRSDYLSAGVPPALLDLAEPIFNRPSGFVVDLSNDGGTEINVGEIVAKLLDAAKGTIDLSAEQGHSGTFKSGDGEDPDAEALALWDAQFQG